MKNGFYRLLVNGDSQTGMQPSNFTDPMAFTSADKSEINHTFFNTEDESVLVGVWECAPCKEEIDSYPVHEMMTVISGSVTLTDENDRAETFVAGDTFFIAKGTRCTWQITEKLKKFYMIVE